MNKIELTEVKLKKENMKLYSIHKALTSDLLFYYSTYILLLTQIKNIPMQYIILGASFYQIFFVSLQIPTTMLADRIGYKRGTILGDILIAISIFLMMVSNSFPMLIFTYFIMAFGYSLKDFSEDYMLALSLPEVETKTGILSKIYSKGIGNYFILAAIAALIAGFLYKLNPYLPLIICMMILLIGARIACLYNTIKPESQKQKEEIKRSISERYKEYFKDLSMGFKFIFSSARLRSLLLYGAIMYGIINVMLSYGVNLLSDIGLSSVAIGAIFAAMQILCGISAKKQNKFHNSFRNKTLTIIGLGFSVSLLMSGILSTSTVPFEWMISLIVVCYLIMYSCKGLYYVLIKRYISNFAGTRIVSKIYTSYGIISSLGSCVIGFIASYIVANNNIRYSMIIFGILSTVSIIICLLYMKTRVGLKPSQYKKEEISYKEFANKNHIK